ncbi:MAG TPA: response regulator [Planctomycetota bacterium]
MSDPHEHYSQTQFYRDCNYQILIIEDDYDTGDALVLSLARRGYGVRIVNSREAALPVLQQYHHDLILMDLRMPGMDANSFMTEVSREWPDCKVILMTADTRAEDAARALKIAQWLKKPFDLDELETAVLLAQESCPVHS